MAWLPAEILHHIMSFLDDSDLEAVGQVCPSWTEAARDVLHRRKVNPLTEKALEWVEANSTAMIAGSLALYHYLLKETGRRPLWLPTDADVWIVYDKDGDILLDGPDLDKLPIPLDEFERIDVGTIIYPFGTLQVIALPFTWNYDTTQLTLSSILDSFDHSACMIGMRDYDDFILGPHFNISEPTMFKTVDHDKYIVPRSTKDRFDLRLQKYTQRGLAPVHFVDRPASEDHWLTYYIDKMTAKPVRIRDVFKTGL